MRADGRWEVRAGPARVWDGLPCARGPQRATEQARDEAGPRPLCRAGEGQGACPSQEPHGGRAGGGGAGRLLPPALFALSRPWRHLPFKGRSLQEATPPPAPTESSRERPGGCCSLLGPQGPPWEGGSRVLPAQSPAASPSPFRLCASSCSRKPGPLQADAHLKTALHLPAFAWARIGLLSFQNQTHLCCLGF